MAAANPEDKEKIPGAIESREAFPGPIEKPEGSPFSEIDSEVKASLDRVVAVSEQYEKDAEALQQGQGSEIKKITDSIKEQLERAASEARGETSPTGVSAKHEDIPHMDSAVQLPPGFVEAPELKADYGEGLSERERELESSIADLRSVLSGLESNKVDPSDFVYATMHADLKQKEAELERERGGVPVEVPAMTEAQRAERVIAEQTNGRPLAELDLPRIKLNAAETIYRSNQEMQKLIAANTNAEFSIANPLLSETEKDKSRSLIEDNKQKIEKLTGLAKRQRELYDAIEVLNEPKAVDAVLPGTFDEPVAVVEPLVTEPVAPETTPGTPLNESGEFIAVRDPETESEVALSGLRSSYVEAEHALKQWALGREADPVAGSKSAPSLAERITGVPGRRQALALMLADMAAKEVTWDRSGGTSPQKALESLIMGTGNYSNQVPKGVKFDLLGSVTDFTSPGMRHILDLVTAQVGYSNRRGELAREFDAKRQSETIEPLTSLEAAREVKLEISKEIFEKFVVDEYALQNEQRLQLLERDRGEDSASVKLARSVWSKAKGAGTWWRSQRELTKVGISLAAGIGIGVATGGIGSIMGVAIRAGRIVATRYLGEQAGAIGAKIGGATYGAINLLRPESEFHVKELEQQKEGLSTSASTIDAEHQYFAKQMADSLEWAAMHHARVMEIQTKLEKRKNISRAIGAIAGAAIVGGGTYAASSYAHSLEQWIGGPNTSQVTEQVADVNQGNAVSPTPEVKPQLKTEGFEVTKQSNSIWKAVKSQVAEYAQQNDADINKLGIKSEELVELKTNPSSAASARILDKITARALTANELQNMGIKNVGARVLWTPEGQIQVTDGSTYKMGTKPVHVDDLPKTRADAPVGSTRTDFTVGQPDLKPEVAPVETVTKPMVTEQQVTDLGTPDGIEDVEVKVGEEWKAGLYQDQVEKAIPIIKEIETRLGIDLDGDGVAGVTVKDFMKIDSNVPYSQRVGIRNPSDPTKVLEYKTGHRVLESAMEQDTRWRPRVNQLDMKVRDFVKARIAENGSGDMSVKTPVEPTPVQEPVQAAPVQQAPAVQPAVRPQVLPKTYGPGNQPVNMPKTFFQAPTPDAPPKP